MTKLKPYTGKRQNTGIYHQNIDNKNFSMMPA